MSTPLETARKGLESLRNKEKAARKVPEYSEYIAKTKSKLLKRDLGNSRNKKSFERVRVFENRGE